jgi:hypothetical protein
VFVFHCRICLLLWLLSPSRPLGAARIVEQRKVLVSGSDRGDCEGFLCFPYGRSQKASLVDCAWLMDPHLVFVVRHPIEGLMCDAN